MMTRLCQRGNKLKKHEGDYDINHSWSTGNSIQELGKETRELKIRGRIKTIQIAALLKPARILRRVLDLLSHRLQ